MLISCGRFLLPGFLLFAIFSLSGFAQQSTSSEVAVPLVVSRGTPLRLQVDSTSFPKHVGDVVHAQPTLPVYAFDRRHESYRTRRRIWRIVAHAVFPKHSGGHFGSFRRPEVEFDTLLPAGKAPRQMMTETAPSNGRVVEMRASGRKKHGRIGAAVSRGKKEVRTRISRAKTFLKSQHKKHALRDAALDLLPYRPARIADGSTFDAVLSAPQSFGAEQVPAERLLKLGQITPEDGTTQANLMTDLDSARTAARSPLKATITAPLFASDGSLLLPEGTRLLGTTSLAHPARHFHRNGQLRFSFQEVELPPDIVAIRKRLLVEVKGKGQTKIRAGLSGLTTRSGSHVTVDEEGAPRIEESKTHFLGPAISVALVAAAAQQEQERGAVENRTGAQAAAGTIGLGLVGLVIGRYSNTGALALGSLGAARSVYSQFFAKGYDIQIPSNTLLLIQFGRTGNVLPKRPAKN